MVGKQESKTRERSGSISSFNRQSSTAATRERSQSITAARNTQQKESKVKEVIDALVTSQREYVEKLERLIKVFVRPASDSSVGAKYRQAIFSNVKEIYTVHISIHSDLEFGTKQEVEDITNTFIDKRNDLDVHAEYNYHLPKALETLEYLKANEPNVYKKITHGEIPTLRLRELLSGVPEILPTYIQHFEEMLKACRTLKEDKAHVKKVLVCLRDLTEHLQVKMADLVVHEQLTKLQQHISTVQWGQSSLVRDFGRLLMQGDITSKRTEAENEKARYAILLEKLIVITKPLRHDSYVFEMAIDLSKVSFIDETRGGHVRLERTDHVNGSVTLLFHADSKSVTKKWLETIKTARDRLYPREASDEDHSFYLHTFKLLTECDECQLLLKGGYSQGYHCTKTGKNAHFGCLEAAKRLPNNIASHRMLDDPKITIPVSALGDEARRCCFGGYFGRIIPQHVVREAGRLKTTSEAKLQGTTPAAPHPFVMWESKNKGTEEKTFPKAGFIGHLCTELSYKPVAVTFEDIENLIKQYHGRVNNYTESETGELFVAGYYQEFEDAISSEEEEGEEDGYSTSLRPKYSSSSLPAMDIAIKSSYAMNSSKQTSSGKTKELSDKRLRVTSNQSLRLSPDLSNLQSRSKHSSSSFVLPAITSQARKVGQKSSTALSREHLKKQ